MNSDSESLNAKLYRIGRIRDVTCPHCGEDSSLRGWQVLVKSIYMCYSCGTLFSDDSNDETGAYDGDPSDWGAKSLAEVGFAMGIAPVLAVDVNSPENPSILAAYIAIPPGAGAQGDLLRLNDADFVAGELYRDTNYLKRLDGEVRAGRDRISEYRGSSIPLTGRRGRFAGEVKLKGDRVQSKGKAVNQSIVQFFARVLVSGPFNAVLYEQATQDTPSGHLPPSKWIIPYICSDLGYVLNKATRRLAELGRAAPLPQLIAVPALHILTRREEGV